MYTIRLKHNSNSIVIRRAGVGPTGPQGPQGDPGDTLIDSVNGQIGTVVLDQDDVLDGVNYKQYSSIEKTKLASVTNGATPNNISDTNATDLTDGGDSTLHFHSSDRNRTNHTGTQLASTISDFSTAADARVAAAPSTGTGSLVRSSSPLITTPTGIVKGDVGLGNVDNTSDANKPVSTAQSTAINAKVTDAIVDAVTTVAPSQNAVFDALALKQPLDSDLTTIAGLTATTDNFMVANSSAWASRTPAQAKTSLALTKTDVSLANVDNTSDATKNSATATLTNKRITKRVSSNTSSATPTPNADTDDVYLLTAQAATAAFAAPTGTPTPAQPLVIRIKDNGVARTISWDGIYRAIGVTLPTTTVISKTLYIGFMYNFSDTRWDCLAVSLEA